MVVKVKSFGPTNCLCLSALNVSSRSREHHFIIHLKSAVIIQREAGGNLAEVLEKLGYTIRERFKLKGQIAALTGQSRMTGYVLGAAPILLLSFLTLIMYGYVKPLYESDLGHILLLVILVLQVIGFMIMKKIIDIRV